MRAWAALAFVVMAPGPAAAQEGATPRSSPPPVVVRVGVDAVQVDTVVTDAKGRHVRDLRAEDFEIVEDGTPQPITHCEFVAVEPESAEEALVQAPEAAPRRTRPPRREQVRRTLVLVVDDLGLSMRTLQLVKESLSTFVETQMGGGDLVAIVRTGEPVNLVPLLTTDKVMLRATIAELRYNGLAMQARSASAESREQCPAPLPPMCTLPVEAARRQRLIARTLQALESVADTLVGLPGRKAIVVFSQRLSLRDETTAPLEPDEFRLAPIGRDLDPALLEQMRVLTERANRASVVIHTIDPRGLLHKMPFSEEYKSLPHEIADDQGGLQSIAHDTGGTFHPFANDIPGAVGRVMDDLGGYYLLGYNPPPGAEAAGKGARYHQVKVAVKREGLKVRYRKGYFGGTRAEYEARSAVPTTPAAAASSPLAATDLPVRLTTVFGHDPKGAGVLRSFVHVEGAGIQLEAQPDGSHRGELELSGVVFGDNGVVIDHIEKRLALNLRKDTEDSLRRAGGALEFSFAIKKPGPYLVRAAVKDVPSGRIGAAGRFVIVPDLGKKQLALSSLVLGGLPCRAVQPTEGSRRFCAGSEIVYGLAVYHPKVDKQGQPRLQAQVRLAQDGQIVYAGQTVALEGVTLLETGNKNLSSYAVAGTFPLPPASAPGEYVLELLVTDTLARKQTATASLDFEVVP